MKKLSIYIVFILLLNTFILIGCNKTSLTFKELSYNEIPQNIKTSMFSLPQKRGYFVYDESSGVKNGYIIYINAGPTNKISYEILVKDIIIQNDSLNIVIKEIPSRSNSSKVIYPNTILYITNTKTILPKNITLKNTLNETLNSIPVSTPKPAQTTSLKTFKGTYIGQIDSNSIEFNIEGIPMTFFLKNSDQVNILKENANYTVTSYKNQYGQWILEEIK